MPEIGTTATVIGPAARIKGEVSFEGPAHIMGTIEGSIRSTDLLHVGEGAACKANIEAGHIIVDGAVEGDLTGQERVELNAGARVKGDITAATLAVAAGASFSGHVRVGGSAGPGKPARPPGETPVAVVRAAAETLLSAPPQVRAGWVGPAKIATP
ncbi:MAG: polymer-forming cytoskeletal protein [Phycisphaerae bacterium]|nr:polymer-forming cytoskeletal protein [Phycisphaerae bacterium]